MYHDKEVTSTECYITGKTEEIKSRKHFLLLIVSTIRTTTTLKIARSTEMENSLIAKLIKVFCFSKIIISKCSDLRHMESLKPHPKTDYNNLKTQKPI
jgi:hypothetical protein